LASGPKAFMGPWDPKKDFALAMLHAERLIRILTDVAVCEILLDQSTCFPERRDILERYLERAESRCRSMQYEITHTGKRVLSALTPTDAETK